MKKFIEGFTYQDLVIFQRAFIGLLLFFLLKNGYDTCMEVRYHAFQNPNGLMQFIPQIFFQFDIFVFSYVALILLSLASVIFPLRWYLITPLTFLYVLCMGVSETLYTTYSHQFFHVKSTLIAPLIALTLASFLKKDLLPKKSFQFGLPIIFTHFMLSLIYLGPNIKRILSSGFPGWYNGETLKVYLIESSVLFSNPASLWIAQSLILCMALQLFTLLFEATFWVGLFNNKFLRFSLISALFFHLGVEVLMRANYLDYFLCLFTIFVTRPYRMRLYSGKKTSELV